MSEAIILGLDPATCDGVYPRTRDGRCQGCGVVGDHQKVLLYSIEPAHLARLRTIAKRLYTEDRLTGDEMRDAAHGIMAAVNFAESLEALRGPGQPYVHMTPKKEESR